MERTAPAPPLHCRPVLARLHLVRHGEVDNPNHVVYADLRGFHLSETGRDQARSAAARLAGRSIGVVLSSPLDRAMETAAILADRLGCPARPDDRLTEWRLAKRWAGVVWERLPEVFPGELEAYLDHPHDLPFASESIDQVGRRMARLVEELSEARPGDEPVLVSHQDPVQALRLHLTGRPMRRLADGKPGHCAVITVEPGDPWREADYWEPAGSRTFPPPGARSDRPA